MGRSRVSEKRVMNIPTSYIPGTKYVLHVKSAVLFNSRYQRVAYVGQGLVLDFCKNIPTFWISS